MTEKPDPVRMGHQAHRPRRVTGKVHGSPPGEPTGGGCGRGARAAPAGARAFAAATWWPRGKECRETELSANELVLLAFCSANFGVTLELIEQLHRYEPFDNGFADRLHGRMTAAVDAAETAVPTTLAAGVRGLFDAALGELRDHIRYGV